MTLKMPLPAPAPIFANFIDRLVVLDELSPAAQTDPYGWSPLPTDRTKLAGRSMVPSCRGAARRK